MPEGTARAASSSTMRRNMPMMVAEACPAHLGETSCLTYDYNGNTLTKADSTGTTNYTWDFENRLTSVTLPGSGGTVSFKYDPFGRRIYKSSSAGTSVYAYDKNNLIEETNSSGTAVARYAQALKMDEELAMLRNGTTSYYEADGLGTATSLSNAAGALAQTYTFDSFGNQTGSSGSLVNPFQYTAREFDSETNLYYFRARYVDPSTGRFLSEDPLGFGADWGSLYRYAYGNPTNFVDPLGMTGQGTSTPVADPPATGSPSGPSSPGGPSGPSSNPGPGLPKTGPGSEPIPIWPGIIPILKRLPWGLPFWLWPTPTGNDALRPDFPPPMTPPKAPPCKTSKECEKEWAEAFADCAKELAKPHPSRAITGGYNNLYDCARGLVSEACGGNPVGGKNK